MSNLTDNHNKAMDLAEEAFLAKLHGDSEKADKLNQEAFQLEKKAAESVADDQNAEPSRSVLLRSAASLAIECGQLREAERLIAIALSGEPPDEIAEELRDQLEIVYFKRHLELRGITLDENEIQLSIAGNAVGLGSPTVMNLSIGLKRRRLLYLEQRKGRCKNLSEKQEGQARI